MEKELTEQAMAQLAVIHCKIAVSHLVALATETSNPALRDQVQKAIAANLKQQKLLEDAAFHAGFLPSWDFNLHTLNQADRSSPSPTPNFEQEER